MKITDAVMLSVNGIDYPIKLVEQYASTRGARIGLRRRQTVLAATKMANTISASKRDAPIVQLSGLRITPFLPVDAEIKARVGSQQGERLLQTFVDLAQFDGTNGFARVVVEELTN